MKDKILALAGSSSKKSINKKLVNWVASLFENYDTELLDLNDYEVPLFSVDYEADYGFSPRILELHHKISQSDLILISLAEHNGSYSAAFKNVFDWLSRIPNTSVFQGKSLFLMSTSPGARGGKSVLDAAIARFPFNGAVVAEHFSLPKFYETFDENDGIIDVEKKSEILEKVKYIKELIV